LPGKCLEPAEAHSYTSAYTEAAGLPGDLARVVSAWPQLPEHIRAAVLALVQTGQPSRG